MILLNVVALRLLKVPYVFPLGVGTWAALFVCAAPVVFHLSVVSRALSFFLSSLFLTQRGV